MFCKLQLILKNLTFASKMSVAGGSGGNQQQTEAELSDPVLLSFRFGQEQAKNVLRDTFKCCNTGICSILLIKFKYS